MLKKENFLVGKMQPDFSWMKEKLTKLWPVDELHFHEWSCIQQPLSFLSHSWLCLNFFEKLCCSKNYRFGIYVYLIYLHNSNSLQLLVPKFGNIQILELTFGNITNKILAMNFSKTSFNASEDFTMVVPNNQLTAIFWTASLIFSTFASDIPLIWSNFLLVVIWIPWNDFRFYTNVL